MLLLDQNAAIKKTNNTIFRIPGKEPFTQVTNKKIGDIFDCPNKYNSEKGCGHNDECSSCELYRIIKKACGSEKSITNTDIKHMVFINGVNTKLWFRINSVPLIIDGERHTLVILDDITGLKQLQEELKDSNGELQNALKELRLTQNHLIQQEKLAGIGQLAAGVAQSAGFCDEQF